MALKVGINGFGRIGRMVLRSIIENNRKDIEIVAINNRGNSEVSSFLLKHDTCLLYTSPSPRDRG